MLLSKCPYDLMEHPFGICPGVKYLVFKIDQFLIF